MNVFSITGDLLHLISIWCLFFILFKRKSCGSVSGKTVLLFAIAYTTRYLDLFSSTPNATFMTVYLWVFKVTYIATYWVIVFMVFCAYRKTYRQSDDTFFTELLLFPSFMLALWCNYDTETLEILWTFSIYLEAVAILPQFFMIYKQRSVENILMYYLVPLGFYRLFYVFNWVYRFSFEGHFDVIADVAGMVYVFLYICALITFWIAKVKITNDGGNLERNIFLISGNEFENPMVNEEKKVANDTLLGIETG